MDIKRIVNKILNEVTTTYSRGGYDYPLQTKIRNFKKTSLDPYNVEVNLGDDPKDELRKNKKKKLKSLVEDVLLEFKPNEVVDDDFVEITKDTISEDLAVWFGKKKKPKGSKQPKGPWVDICRKVDGKHPPCGRKDADKGSYPKCRAAGVAGKMEPSEKRRACRQKRAAERKDTQTGKGQKPNWVSHKKRKKKK
jgi:hypothetical protein